MSLGPNTWHQTPNAFIIALTDFPLGIRTRHSVTLSLIRMRGNNSISGHFTMIEFENSIRGHVEWTCNAIEQHIAHAHSRRVTVQGATAMMQMSRLLVDRDARMHEESLEVKIRAMDVLFRSGLMWVYGPNGRGSVVAM
ncbi:hypothetical protein G7Y79_00019g047460 [Physcia stellaris]|nr:hypothetical protein G7Y79_00019g047460 [Physcia stellaris]